MIPTFTRLNLHNHIIRSKQNRELDTTFVFTTFPGYISKTMIQLSMTVIPKLLGQMPPNFNRSQIHKFSTTFVFTNFLEHQIIMGNFAKSPELYRKTRCRKIIINLCCKHINGRNQLHSLITHITRTPESKVFITNSFLLIPFLIYLINQGKW